MDKWPFWVAAGIAPDDAQIYCVNDANWQKTRLSMKGAPTAQKLDILMDWHTHGVPSRAVDNLEVNPKGYAPAVIVTLQITNYLGALRRGGQLDADNKVRKYI